MSKKKNKIVEKDYGMDDIEMEIINAEHRYELNSLNWRFSFLL